MLNIQVVNTLKNKGFEISEIMKAIHTAEKDGEAVLEGWTIRYNDRGEMITVHPSWCGIYVGDYNSHVIFQKNLSYHYKNFGFMSAKYSDLDRVLSSLAANKTNGYILCECSAGQYSRRKKQVEKLGYTVYKTNISACTSEISTCVFLIA